MIALLALGIVVGLAYAVLFPGDPERRRQRVRRVSAASASFCLIIGLSAAIADTGGAGAPDMPFWASMLSSAMTFPLHLIPFGLADRLAVRLGARRRPFWALAAISVGIAWAAVVYFLLLGTDVGSIALSQLVIDLLLPGLAAGVAWFAMLVDEREQVRAIFE